MNRGYRRRCRCGHPSCGGWKYWQIDPYLADVENCEEWAFMCDGDAQERADDI